MIQRFDQLAVDLPEPDGPNPAAAAAVQELMGGKFGEMSTLMNYTFQSFNFRGRDKYRPILRAHLQHRCRGIQPHRGGRGDDQPVAQWRHAARGSQQDSNAHVRWFGEGEKAGGQAREDCQSGQRQIRRR